MGGGVWRESRDVVFVEHLRGASRVGMSGLPTQSLEFQCPNPSESHTSRQFPVSVISPSPSSTEVDTQ
jgi:hypothetical protein